MPILLELSAKTRIFWSANKPVASNSSVADDVSICVFCFDDMMLESESESMYLCTQILSTPDQQQKQHAVLDSSKEKY